jgi:hypothetical protein
MIEGVVVAVATSPATATTTTWAGNEPDLAGGCPERQKREAAPVTRLSPTPEQNHGAAFTGDGCHQTFAWI